MLIQKTIPASTLCGGLRSKLSWRVGRGGGAWGFHNDDNDTYIAPRLARPKWPRHVFDHVLSVLRTRRLPRHVDVRLHREAASGGRGAGVAAREEQSEQGRQNQQRLRLHRRRIQPNYENEQSRTNLRIRSQVSTAAYFISLKALLQLTLLL